MLTSDPGWFPIHFSQDSGGGTLSGGCRIVSSRPSELSASGAADSDAPQVRSDLLPSVAVGRSLERCSFGTLAFRDPYPGRDEPTEGPINPSKPNSCVGFAITFRNTMLISGGSPWVKKGQIIAASNPALTPFDRLPEQSENVDIMPTVAWLLGLDIKPADFPEGSDFDGRILTQAFSQFDTNTTAASPTVCGRFN